MRATSLERPLFYATSRDGRTFSPRTRLPAAGITPGHPQMTLAADGGAVIVWDETVDGVHRVVLAAGIAIARDRAVAGAERNRISVAPGHRSNGRDLVVAWTNRDESVIRVRRVEPAK